MGAAGLIFIVLSVIYRPVTINVDGEAMNKWGWALTAGSVLRSTGVSLASEDRVNPGVTAIMIGNGDISIRRSQVVQVWVDGRLKSFTTAERFPGNLAALADVRLYPGDRVFVDGLPADPGAPLEVVEGGHILEIQRAREIRIADDGAVSTLYSSRSTLGEALWEAGIRLAPQDRLSPDPATPLVDGLTASIFRARAYRISMQAGEKIVQSAGKTTGEVLVEAGSALQGLDYSIPPENEPPPTDGNIRLVRVREEVLLENKSLPFKSVYQPDPQTELDRQSVLTPGVTGLQVKRIRVRYEDGKETGRQEDGEWIARNPVDQVTGYGTNVVVRTAVVDGVTIEYWRAVNVYATSYAPCKNGSGSCSRTTASGAPLQKGVAAVIPGWYYAMKGQQVYVPGYGTATIADMGYGPGTSHWIDLGYSDDDFVGWHSNVTIYFLTPVPENIPWTLP